MKRRFILVVEDNPDDEMLILRTLRKHNVANNIEVVRDGEEALNFLFAEREYSERDSSDLPEVVLLDLMLPKLNGIEVLKAVRQNEKTRFLPVVILTSSDEEKDLIESYQLGANSYVRKPVDF